MAKCKSCDREILWAVTPKGKRIPLELCKHAYTCQQEFAEGPNGPMAMPFTTDVYVSHFLTCSAASTYSGQSKSKASKPAWIVVEGDTYAAREALRAMGFRWGAGSHDWRKQVPDDKVDEWCELVRKRCPGVTVRCEV